MKQIIHVPTEGGESVPVEAEIHGNWAVHRPPYRLSGYTITHVPSGRCAPEHSLIMMGATTKKTLVALAKAMGNDFPQAKVTRAIGRRMYESMKRRVRSIARNQK